MTNKTRKTKKFLISITWIGKSIATIKGGLKCDRLLQ